MEGWCRDGGGMVEGWWRNGGGMVEEWWRDGGWMVEGRWREEWREELREGGWRVEGRRRGGLVKTRSPYPPPLTHHPPHLPHPSHPPYPPQPLLPTSFRLSLPPAHFTATCTLYCHLHTSPLPPIHPPPRSSRPIHLHTAAHFFLPSPMTSVTKPSRRSDETRLSSHGGGSAFLPP